MKLAWEAWSCVVIPFPVDFEGHHSLTPPSVATTASANKPDQLFDVFFSRRSQLNSGYCLYLHSPVSGSNYRPGKSTVTREAEELEFEVWQRQRHAGVWQNECKHTKLALLELNW